MPSPEATARHWASQRVSTLIIRRGRAGLATSYWLTRAGVEHQLLERRETLGGAWQDRWDAFCLNTPNFSLALPGMRYDGPAPEAFMLREDLIGHFRHYAESIDAPVRTGPDVTRIAPADGGGFSVATTQGSWRARNVVLATGGYHKPKIPALSAQLHRHILQLHTDSYRNPGQLPEGAVLIVGTGQSSGQIAEELLAVGREIHLAMSTCLEAPRRYRGPGPPLLDDAACTIRPRLRTERPPWVSCPPPRRASPATCWCPAPTAATTSTCGTSAAGASGCTAVWKQPTTATSSSVMTFRNAWPAGGGVLAADEADVRQLYCRHRHVGTGAGAATQGRLTTFGAGAAEPRSRQHHVGSLGHGLPAGLQHPGHPGAGRVELPPAPPRRHRTPGGCTRSGCRG